MRNEMVFNAFLPLQLSFRIFVITLEWAIHVSERRAYTMLHTMFLQKPRMGNIGSSLLPLLEMYVYKKIS